MTPPPPSTIHARLSTILEELFPDAGIRVRMLEADQEDADIFMELDGQPLLAGEVRHLNPASAVGIEGLVARGALRHFTLHGQTLLVIVVPRLTAGMIHEVRGNLAKMLTAVDARMPFNWVVIAARGGVVVSLPSWSLEGFRADAKAAAMPDLAAAGEPLAFTDANQAALKALLYAWLSASHQEWAPSWWGGRAKGYASVTELAAAADIGSASAYRLMGALWERGLAVPKHAALKAVDILLEEWLRARAREAQPRWYPVRPAQPPAGPMDRLAWMRRAQIPAHVQVAVSGWSALALHKQLIAPGLGEYQPVALLVPGLMHIEGVTEALRLIPSERERAWFVIGQAPQPRSSFAGIVHIDGLPVVDLWQAALDVEGDLNRGREQAEQVKHLLAITA